MSEPIMQPTTVREKLQQLERRLIVATLDPSPIVWTHDWSDATYEWESRKGSVEVSATEIVVRNERGGEEHRFAPETDALWRVVADRHEQMVGEVLDRILADLEPMRASLTMISEPRRVPLPPVMAPEPEAVPRRRWWGRLRW